MGRSRGGLTTKIHALVDAMGRPIRLKLTARGAWGNIRPMPNRVRHPAFSPWIYRQRNAVERFFNKLKHFHAVATRYDKRDDNYLASVQLASMRIWLQTYESVT